MVQFCTNCGTKLEDNDNFCTNCGNRVNDSILSIIRNSTQQNIPKSVTEKTEAKKELNRLTGGILLSHSFDKILRSNDLTTKDGFSIQKQMKEEINSGEIKSDDVETRVNQLILEYKSNKEIEKEEKIEIEELKKNRIEYIENIIKKSHPHIKLTGFEKKYIDNLRLGLSNIEAMKKLFDDVAIKIINEHEKIGEYDFAGILIEDGGFTNRVDIITLQKNVRKDRNFISNVFLKIFENKIKIVGSEIIPFALRPRTGRDMTIFFKDITTIDYSNNSFGEININLSNNTKLRLDAYEGDEKYIEDFYKLLNNVLENFKNNATEKNSSTNEKVEFCSADELMKYAELYEKGLLSEEEFNAFKKKLLEL